MTFQSLYEILGVQPTATPGEIKDAYRRLAMKWHPDRNLGNKTEAGVRFKEIGYAYKVLSDPDARAAYDSELKSQKSQSSNSSFGASAYSHDSSHEDADEMFFEQMLDLAFELSRRGYRADKILKMLLALDCPEGIARAVAKRLEELGASGKSNRSGSAQRERTAKQGHDNSASPIEKYAYAGFWVRCGAMIVDVIPVILMWMPIWILFTSMNVELTTSPLYWVVSWIPGWLYYGFCESGVHQATWGKRALGLRVTDISGNRISFWRATGRYFGRILSCVPIVQIQSFISLMLGNVLMCADFLIQPFTARKQTLHDKLAGTVVVRVEKKGGWIVAAAVFFEAIAISILIAIEAPQFVENIAKEVAKEERMAVQQIVKNALAVRSARQDNPKLTESQMTGMNLWNTQVFEKMAQEPKATEELANIIKLHPEFTVGIDSQSYDPYALHYVFSDHVAWYLQSGKQPLDAIRSAYADIQGIGFGAAVTQAKAAASNKKMMAAAISDLEAHYPQLNPQHTRFNQKLTDEALSRQKAYITQGFDPVTALTTAVSDMAREAATPRTDKR